MGIFGNRLHSEINSLIARRTDRQIHNYYDEPIKESRSQWQRGRRHGFAAAGSLGLWGSNPRRGHGCLYVVSVVFCQVNISASG